jgi:hypothetical protein
MPSFFADLWALLLGVSGPELGKKRTLKNIGRSIGANRNKRFYRLRTQELTPAAAKFFFDIYQVFFPAQAGWRGATESTRFKELVIRHFVPPDILARLDELSGSVLQEQMRAQNAKQVAYAARKLFQSITRPLEKQHGDEIDACYRHALLLEQLITFDYFLLLKKFGVTLREYVVTGNPVFIPVRGAAVSGELKDFLYVALPIEPKQDWNTIFGLFKEWKDADVIPLDKWYRLLTQIQDVTNSRIFDLIIRHVDGNPDWAAAFPQNREPVLKPWIDARRRDLDAVLDKLIQVQWTARIGQLSRLVFGDEPIPVLTNYTVPAGEQITGRGFAGFIHAEGLNYLTAFIALFDLEIRDLCDFLTIRAWWAVQPLSFSEQCLFLTELQQKIAAFDDSVKKDGVRGYKLYQLLGKSGRDRLLTRSIQDSLRIINDEAKALLIEGSQSLAIIQKSIEDVKVDYSLEPPLMILNWPFLEQAARRLLQPWLIDASEKLNAFAGMIDIFVQDAGGAPVETLNSLE